MADQADVEMALAALIANTLYPNGTASPSVTNTLYRVYRGYPSGPVLDAELAAGIVHISVAPAGGEVRNVTRYPRIWREVAPVSKKMSVFVNGVSAAFSGICAVGQLAGVMVNNTPFPYAVQSMDRPVTVASNLAAQIREAGWIVEYSGSQLSVPGASQFTARVVEGAGAVQEIKRQAQDFKISTWCPDPLTRDIVVPVIDLALASTNFIPLVDGSFGWLRFSGVSTSDASADTQLYRRDLIYTVEYPSLIAQLNPAMLFSDVSVSVNNVALANLHY